LTLAAAATSCSQGYRPGLGELMSFTQMRHAKLWFAGEAQNWKLAEYETDELQEGFDDVVLYHAEHKDSPLPLTLLVPKIMTQPMKDVREAIRAHDPAAFVAAFDALTVGCNSCHQATNFGFNVVQRPSGTSWFANQAFAAGAGSDGK
jgi:hypothetical protein